MSFKYLMAGCSKLTQGYTGLQMGSSSIPAKHLCRAPLMLHFHLPCALMPFSVVLAAQQ